MARTNQSGSIVGFVIIGAVMALLLIGGIYLVRYVFVPAADMGTSVTQESGPSDEASDTSDDENVAELPGGEVNFEMQPDKQPAPESTVASPDNLPETGPENLLLSGFLLGAIVTVALAYKRSRDLVSSL